MDFADFTCRLPPCLQAIRADARAAVVATSGVRGILNETSLDKRALPDDGTEIFVEQWQLMYKLPR